MRRAWPLLVVVFVPLGIVGSNAWSADLDAAALLGTWSGTWESPGGATAGRGDAQFTFKSVDANSVSGTYRLTRSGVPTRGRGTPFIDNEVQFSGNISSNTVVIPANPSLQQGPGTLTVSGTQMSGRLGQVKIDVKKAK